MLVSNPTAHDEADKQVALKAMLKAERERRRAAEERLRQVLSALRIKVDAGPGPHPVPDVDLDRVLWNLRCSESTSTHSNWIPTRGRRPRTRPCRGAAGRHRLDRGPGPGSGIAGTTGPQVVRALIVRLCDRAAHGGGRARAVPRIAALVEAGFASAGDRSGGPAGSPSGC